LIGKTILHYRIIEKIGEGGMGVVYKAEDTKLKRTVALKFLPRGLDAHEPERARFLQEAQAASALNHPHVCTIHDICEVDGQQFIVMEYVDGVTLWSRIEQQPIKVNDALAYAIQIGEALQEAHANGIVHRDIKPANIMINTKNQIKVMDFGLAKLKGSLKLTRTSSTVGTLAYMAPEQLEGREVDARSDIFSFGVVLYEMLTGRRPFGGETEAAMMHSILATEPEPIQKHLPNTTSEVIHILNRALEKDPEDRYQSVTDMLIDLRRAKKETSRVSRESLAARTAEQPLPGISPVASRPTGDFAPSAARAPTAQKPWTPRKTVLLPGLIVVLAAAAILIFTPILPSRRLPALNPQMTFRTLEIPFSTIGYPGLSRDGNWVAFTAEEAPHQWALYFLNVAKGAPRRLTTLPGYPGPMGSCEISRDNSEIVYDGPAPSGAWGAYVVSSSGGTGRKIAEPASYCRWQPDGKRIGYMRVDNDSIPISQRKREFWTVGPDGSDNRLEFVDSLSQIDSPWSFDWSPDGRSIAWLRCFSGYSEIVIHDLASGRERQITSFGKPIDELAWASNGQIFFASSKGGNSNIWMMPAKGGEAVQVTRGSGPDLSVRVSDNSRRLIFLEGRNVSYIWTADIDGRHEKQVTFENQRQSWPTFSRDGSRIAFELSSDDVLRPGSQIFTTKSDGSDRTQITTGEGWHWSPKWSRDGKYLAFVSHGVDEPSESSRVYITEALNPGMPRLVARGISVGWLDAGRLYVTEPDQSRSIVYSVPGLQQIAVTPDSTSVEYPLADGKHTVFHDMRKGREGMWLKDAGEGQSGTFKRILSPADAHGSIQLSSSRRYILYQAPDGELWRMSVPEGRREKLPDLFKGLNPLTSIRMSPDDKQVVFLKERWDSRIVLIENVFK